jgi:hypothetical protein
MSEPQPPLPTVDWSVFDKWSRSEIECRCGAYYPSHNKTVFYDGRMTILTRNPCPACGSSIDHVRAARQIDADVFSVDKGDVGAVG